jgi:uncharacterized protein
VSRPGGPGEPGLSGAEYVALTSYRRDGTPVTTPVWAAPAADGLIVYTSGRSGKVRRIQRTARVTVAPCDRAGTVTGSAVPGHAGILARSELARAKRALAAKYGLRFRWFTLITFIGRPRRRGGRPVGIEIRAWSAGGTGLGAPRD